MHPVLCTVFSGTSDNRSRDARNVFKRFWITSPTFLCGSKLTESTTFLLTFINGQL